MFSIRYLVALSLPLAFALPASAANFQGLGDLPGGASQSQAFDISADGKIVVGRSVSTSGIEAFRWTAQTGMVGLGRLPNKAQSIANAISDDGSTIVGYSSNEAFRWTTATGMVGLGDFEGGAFNSRAHGVSADGSVIVGYGSVEQPFDPRNTNEIAFRWNAQDGLVALDDYARTCYAYGVSGDGSIVVGSADDFSFRWTTDTGIQLFAGDTSAAMTISANGTYIVGYGFPGGLVRPMLSVNGDEVMFLSGTAPGDSLIAYDVSADGSIVIGGPTAFPSGYAFIWDEAHGMRLVQDVLTDQGLDITGWQLTEAQGISADGRTIVGWGRNPAGATEGWIATIPEPSSWRLVVVAFGLLAGFARINAVSRAIHRTAIHLTRLAVRGNSFRSRGERFSAILSHD